MKRITKLYIPEALAILFRTFQGILLAGFLYSGFVLISETLPADESFIFGMIFLAIGWEVFTEVRHQLRVRRENPELPRLSRKLRRLIRQREHLARLVVDDGDVSLTCIRTPQIGLIRNRGSDATPPRVDGHGWVPSERFRLVTYESTVLRQPEGDVTDLGENGRVEWVTGTGAPAAGFRERRRLRRFSAMTRVDHATAAEVRELIEQIGRSVLAP